MLGNGVVATACHQLYTGHKQTGRSAWKLVSRASQAFTGQFGCAFVKSDSFIHTNPLHHDLTERPEKWVYSSYSAFFSAAPSRVMRSEVMALFGGIAAFETFHQQKNVNNKALNYCLIEA
jgi:hypothetical protein